MMVAAEKVELLALLEERERRRKLNRLAEYRPYPKQAEFHAMGAVKRERMLSAGNQLGKTLCAAAESAMHATGLYPDWWKGRRFHRATSGVAGSESGELTRRGVQRLLFGADPKIEPGTGMVPGRLIESVTWSRHVNDLIDTARIRHASGGISTIGLKSYDQGRGKWQAETLDWAWLDEEPDEDIYVEAMTRTNVSGGPIMVTCTLLKGMTAVASRFWTDRDKFPSVGMVNITIHDVEHYSDERKAEIIAGYPDHEREARTMGVPSMGSGKVFPVLEDSIKVEAFPIPPAWPQLGGMDFGWDHPFAAIRMAWDRDNDVLYVTACHRIREQTPVLHAGALRPWGDWLPWAWPHDGLQHDKGSGEQLAQQYRAQGLRMMAERATFTDGSNGLEAGVSEMLDRMRTGRLKVFSHLAEWFEEFRMYHRKDGLIVKKDDDLMSATRYAMMMRRLAVTSTPVDASIYEYSVDY
ncbi:MAG: terminase large subunit domain-containing protein [Pseudomonas paracarnis]